MSTTLNWFFYPTFIYEVGFRHVETDFIPKIDSVLQNMTINSNYKYSSLASLSEIGEESGSSNFRMTR